MSNSQDESISDIRQRLLEGMTDYMQGDSDDSDENWDCGYSQEHIDRCLAIVDAYLAKVIPNASLSPKQIRTAVKDAVLALNALNDECDGALIETDQREDLCQLIQVAASQAGLDTEDDLTEEWRQW